MANTETTSGRSEARLVVPALIDRPVVGGGCCAWPATELVCESVGRIRGVHSVSCDEEKGVVVVEFDGGSTALETAVAVLDDLGYAVTAVQA